MLLAVAPLEAGRELAIGVATAAGLLLALYLWQRRRLDAAVYQPRLAWLRAGLYFCVCVSVALLSGVIAALATTPLATPAQLASPAWWVVTLVYAGVIVVGYGLIWPRGTFTDGRLRHPLLAPVYGLVWGVCQGLLFLSIWALVERSGLGVIAVAVISYLLIGGYNASLHHFFWDVQVSPPHNYSEWNARKVALCHTPNLILGMAYLALYGNAAIFVLLQGVALALSAQAMRFPAWWDDYRAAPGEERSRAKAVSGVQI